MEMVNISHTYDGSNLKANDGVTFSIYPGEIHGLVGENGAGKTTLMKILTGHILPQEGKILLNGRERVFHHPSDSVGVGIGMVPQHSRLIPEFTVSQNIVLGVEPRVGPLFAYIRANQAVEALIKEHQMEFAPDDKLSSLSASEAQQVDILRVLYRDSRILILDEPTSILTEQEVAFLFKKLNRLTEKGITIVFITHNMAEVIQFSDRVSIMRKARLVAVRKTSEINVAELTQLMIGHDTTRELQRPQISPGSEVYAFRSVSLEKRKQKHPLIDRASFSVREGEILGVTATTGNGLGELEDIASGFQRATSGEIHYMGEDVTAWSRGKLCRVGVSYVPSDRFNRGSSLLSSVEENMVISTDRGFFNPVRWIAGKGRKVRLKALLEKFGVETQLESPIGMLSGGTLQKCILARELESCSRFILFAEPTAGLDLVSTDEIYRRILALKEAGVAMLLLSSSLTDIMSLSDRIVILHSGKIVATLANTPSLDKRVIGEYMLGIRGSNSGVEGYETS